MRVATWAGGWLIASAVGVAPALAGGWDVACGGAGQPACAVSKAKFVSKQGGLCPSGQFYDLIDGGTCWSCPAGFGRTVFSVKDDKACEKVAAQEFRRVEERGKGRGWFGTDCDGGQFWDIVDGNCHSCPGGYAMQVLEHVHGDRKCAKSIPGSWGRATKHGPSCGQGNFWDLRNGGECWSCPNGFTRTLAAVTADNACSYGSTMGIAIFGCKDGLVSIRGTCFKKGECGKNDQRPCDVFERVPSCDDKLKEDFKTNKCVPLKMGETPFTGGLSSLGAYWGGTVQLHCKELLGGINLPFQGDLSVPARCTKQVGVGFTCSLVRDFAAGATDTVNGLMEKIPEGASLATKMNTAANQSPCKEYGERFAKATKHSQATGTVLKTDCPSGQFWDPDGWCYSCPKDYARTLFPVSHERACTDKFGGNLMRFGCGAVQGVAKHFDNPLNCTLDVLRDGSIFAEPITFGQANDVACQATGELGYYLVVASFEAAKAAATGEITGFLKTLGKLKSAAVNALEIKRLLDCGKQKVT
jgi:hypothetical protein